MTYPDTEGCGKSELSRSISDSEVWEFIDQVAVDVLDESLVKRHLSLGQSHPLTTLDINRKLPQGAHPEQQQFFITHPLSITKVIGTNIIPDRISKSKRVEPVASPDQFAYTQAVLCTSAFIAKDLISYLSDGENSDCRVAKHHNDLQFSRAALLDEYQ
jgi:hypothetical protein